jgi:hypothetical protein
LKENKVKLPDWVVFKAAKSVATKNSEKLRKNQPKEEAVEEPVAEEPTEPTEETAAE